LFQIFIKNWNSFIRNSHLLSLTFIVANKLSSHIFKYKYFIVHISCLVTQVFLYLKGGNSRSKSKDGRDLGLQDDTLYGRLKACLTLQGFYRETLRSLRDSIGQSSNMSHFPSLSSVAGPSSFTSRYIRMLELSIMTIKVSTQRLKKYQMLWQLR